jgi:hypothetical protein
VITISFVPGLGVRERFSVLEMVLVENDATYPIIRACLILFCVFELYAYLINAISYEP